MSVIEIRELTKRFGTLTAVDQLSFDVESGTVVGFLGRNGAGKTTTLRMLLGLVTPSSGQALIHGRPYDDLADPLRCVGAVLEATSFHPGRRARDHLRIEALAGAVDPARIGEVLDLVDLTGAADRRIGGFSLGMRQRLGLATALVCDPEILILDEPANGLDPEGVRWLRDLLRGLASEGRTVLVSSHILAEVAQIADSVVILDHGRLITQSALRDLTAAAAGTVRVRTPDIAALQTLLSRQGCSVNRIGDDEIEVSGSTSEQIATLAGGHRIPIYELTAHSPDLEDIFLQLTSGATQTSKEAA